MAEPWEERVAEAVRTGLLGIEGGNGKEIGPSGFWYTPDQVERTRTIEGQGLLTDEKQFQTVYALAPGPINLAESNGEIVEESIFIDFLIARRHPQSDEPFHSDTPIPWTVQNRLFHDFKKKLLADVNLGDLTTNIRWSDVTMEFQSVGVRKWAIVIGMIEPYQSLHVSEF